MRRVVWILVSASVWARVPRAWAQAHAPEVVAAPATPATMARAAFDRGVAALDQERFADAVTAFEESEHLRPLPIVVYNLGLALRGLGRNGAAVEAFERYLREAGPSPPAETVAAVRTQLALLRRSLVVLTVAATPSTANVAIDGRDRGRVGEDLVVDPGTHVIEARAEGFRTQRQEVSLPPSARITLNVQLESLEGTGRLLVEPSVLDAVVSIDGRRIGTGRVEQPVAAGDHVVDITAARYERFHRTIHVGQLGMVRVDANLVRQGMPAWVTSVLIVGSTLVIAGGVTLAVWLLERPRPPEPGQWLTVTEPSANP